MGTDAHAMIEVKKNERWTPHFYPVWPVADFREKGVPPLDVVPGIPRAYGMFSLLADVRNRNGRKGIVTVQPRNAETGELVFNSDGTPFFVEYDMDDGGHDTITPYALPRGVPGDANDGWREFTSQEQIHDPTWLTLRDIQDADWDQVLYEDAAVMEEEYVKYRDEGVRPTLRARDVGGPGVLVVNEVEYAEGRRGERSTAVRFRFTGGTIREESGLAWWAIVAMMGLIAPGGDPDNVRLLLAFDS